jgi:hypothetical protein
MIPSAPAYVGIVFILTAIGSVALLFLSIRTGLRSLPAKVLFVVLPSWMLLQFVIARSGFYQDTSTIPPRLVATGVLPTLVFIGFYFLFFRSQFIELLDLRILTLIHIVRIPVELVLLWLFKNGEVPQAMTFEGLNFDILSGIFALILYFLAFRGNSSNRSILIGFNILGLLLLANIVSIAVMSLPSPMQRMAFDMPNRAVLVFPYIWLPTVVVPIVLFSHLTALWKLIRRQTP